MFRRKRGPEIKQEKYYGQKEMEKKSRKMLKDGWAIKNVEVKKESPGIAFMPLLGPAAFAGVDVYHVTWWKV